MRSGGGGGGFGGPPRLNGGGGFARASPWASANGESSLMSQPSGPMLSPTGGSGGPGGPGKSSTQVTIPKDVSKIWLCFIEFVNYFHY